MFSAIFTIFVIGYLIKVFCDVGTFLNDNVQNIFKTIGKVLGLIITIPLIPYLIAGKHKKTRPVVSSLLYIVTTLDYLLILFIIFFL